MRKRGFTIIELIVVISIIMLLAGLITGGASVARRKALESKAKSDIAALELAIGMFETDTGQYPADNKGSSSNAALVDALESNVIPPVYSNWHGPYMDFKSNDLNVDEEFTDPWGNPYDYDTQTGTIPPPNNTNSYDLSCQSPHDDIYNW